MERDAVFCFPCRHFNPKSGRKEDTFTNTGFRDWKRAVGINGALSIHAKSFIHIQAMHSWDELKRNIRQGTSIENYLRNKQISDDRHYIKSIAEVLLLCSRLEIAL